MNVASGDGPAQVVAIFGPTAVGKTAVAIELAGLLRSAGRDAVAISADALQVYAGLETLTGAPTAAERRRLEHRLVGFLPVTATFSAGEFAARAHAEIDAALVQQRVPIVVGGTGLYLRAALAGLDLAPPPAPGVRERIEKQLEREGVHALHAELAERAPAAAAAVEPADRSRVVRALELLEMGDSPAAGRGSEQLFAAATRHPTFLAGLVMERRRLYAAIDARVERIVAAGAAREVAAAERAGASRTARKALGYAELAAGDVDAMKRRSRNLAKRQLSWMRKLAGVQPIDVTGRAPAAVAAEIAQRARLVGREAAGAPRVAPRGG